MRRTFSLIPALLLGASAHAAVTTDWNSNTNGSFTASASWDNGAPTSADTAVFRRGTGISYTVTFPGLPIIQGTANYFTDKLRVGSNSVNFARSIQPNQGGATYTVTNTTTAVAGRAIIIGELNGDVAVLNPFIPFSGVAATLGDASNASGTLNVNNNTFSITGSNSIDDEFIVGNNGTGILNITNSGHVNLTGTLGDAVLGAQNNGSATVLVDGAGSSFLVNTSLWVGSVGAASVSVTNGGLLSDASALLGVFTTGSTPSVIVDGSGSLWANTGSLIVGYEGRGSLRISNGAHVSDATAIVGNDGNGTGIVTVDGTGSLWSSSGSLTIGNAHSGTLNILNGAHVTNGTGFLASAAGGIGAVLVSGAGSLWTNNGDLSVGYLGAGSLRITNGGQVSDNIGNIGNAPGSSGIVTVDGPGSTWTNNTGMEIGGSGAATLNILNGAQLHFTGGQVDIAGQASSLANITIDGPASSWTNSGFITIGIFGTGNLYVTSGAQLSNTTASIGLAALSVGSVSVDGTGSSWTNSGQIVVGDSGSGFLAITNGGHVSNTNAFIARSQGGFGSVTVDGPGSLWTINGGLTLSSFAASASLSIINAAAVTVNGNITNFGAATLTLNGGTLDLQNHTISVPTLNLQSGTLKNVTQINAGTTGLIKTSSGVLTLPTPNTYSGGTFVNAGTLLIAHPAALGTGGLTINNTALATLQPNLATPVSLPSLTLAHTDSGSSALYTATLQLNNNRLILQSTSPTDKSNKILALNEALFSARGPSNTWTTPGITSSTVAADPTHLTLAIYDNANLHDLTNPALPRTSWHGQPVDANSLLITPALKGDINLDGLVNVNDLVLIAAHFNQTGISNGISTLDMTQGDVNQDGIVNVNDLVLTAANFNATSPFNLADSTQISNLTPQTFPTPIPEPASLALLLLATPLLFRSKSRPYGPG